MQRQLLLLRHAKSDWDQPVADFDRPLNKRGLSALDTIGEWLQKQALSPDIIYSSPAQRATQTALGVSAYLNYSKDAIQWESYLYLASLRTLLTILSKCRVEHNLVMLVGHNPGLEELLMYLLGAEAASADYRMTTATVAMIALPQDWTELSAACGTLQQFIRPREL